MARLNSHLGKEIDFHPKIPRKRPISIFGKVIATRIPDQMKNESDQGLLRIGYTGVLSSLLVCLI